VAKIVLVHGIGAGSSDAETYRKMWLPSLAHGLRRAGAVTLAHDVLRTSGLPMVQLAYYADLLTAPAAQGGGVSHSDSDVSGSWERQLAVLLLRVAAERSTDPHDAEVARQYFASASPPGVVQGGQALLRDPIRALARIRWLALGGMAFAEKRLMRILREVSTYMTIREIRTAAQERVLRLISDETKVVVAHSLGSVVAYEALHAAKASLAFVTIGSPLGIPNVIYDRLEPASARIPECVDAWSNFADIDDLVALVLDLAPLFPPRAAGWQGISSRWTVGEIRNPHDSRGYLESGDVGRAVAEALDR
jgi:hypothetical protein